MVSVLDGVEVIGEKAVENCVADEFCIGLIARSEEGRFILAIVVELRIILDLKVVGNWMDFILFC